MDENTEQGKNLPAKSNNRRLWLILLVPLTVACLSFSCVSVAIGIDSPTKTLGSVIFYIFLSIISLAFAFLPGWLIWKISHPASSTSVPITSTNNQDPRHEGKVSVFDIFHTRRYKAELVSCQAENVKLKQILSETERMSIVEIHAEIDRLSSERVRVEKEIQAEVDSANAKRVQIEKDLQTDLERAKCERSCINQEIENRKKEIEDKNKDLVVLEEEILLQSFGFYKMKYSFDNSEQYKMRAENIRIQQAQMIKDGKAACCSRKWTLEGSLKEGQRMVADYIKLIVRSFNNECDASIVNVKFNNIESLEKKIRKAFEILNKLGGRMGISLSQEYLNLKLQELYLAYEYQVKKQEEKEEQKRIREQMREEAKLMKEIEEAKLRIEKEEKHFTNALQKIQEQLTQATTDEKRSILLEKKIELENQLNSLEKDKLDVSNREQNTRAGYVYVISNIGSFGEDVYKIGVTRRLDPTERVDELGDASVPFDFDIHAMIFSEDAPQLETALHKAFDHRRLNLFNNRREFFCVGLDEIEVEVKKNFNKTVEFTRVAEAAQYRQSLALRNSQPHLN